jgi:putative membrane protein
MKNTFNQYDHDKKLHPMTLMYRGLMNFPILLIPIYLAFFQNNKGELTYLYFFMFSLIFTLPSILLNYLYFSFYITNKELVIKSGVLAKQQRNIPILKIQNINIQQNILQRILGIAKVQVETAGDIKTEGLLEFISKNDAEEISKIIKLYQYELQEEKSGKESGEKLNNPYIDSINDSANKENVIFQMNFKDLLIAGMMKFKPIFLILGTWLFSFLQQFSYFNNNVQEFLNKNVDTILKMDIFSIILFSISAIIVIFILSWLLDILWTVNVYYGFKLLSESNKLITKYGLITKQIVTIPFKKLQQISITTNPIKKKFNYYSLELHTAGFGVQSMSGGIAVPNAKYEKIIEVLNKIRHYNIPEYFIPISKKAISRSFFMYMIYLTILSAGLFFVINELAYVFLCAPLLYLVAYLRWLFRGYKIIDDTVFMKHGVIIQKIKIIPIKKIQILHIRETFFQRRLGLASLYVDTATSIWSSNTVIHDIDSKDAKIIYQELLENFNRIIHINYNRA